MRKTDVQIGVPRTCDELRAMQNRAVAIRKLLSSSRRKGSKDRGVMDDAVQLAEIIEKLSTFGQHCSAEDVVEVASRVEILVSLLESEIDGIFAS